MVELDLLKWLVYEYSNEGHSGCSHWFSVEWCHCVGQRCLCLRTDRQRSGLLCRLLGVVAGRGESIGHVGDLRGQCHGMEDSSRNDDSQRDWHSLPTDHSNGGWQVDSLGHREDIKL